MKTFAALFFTCTQIAFAGALDQPPELATGVPAAITKVPTNINMSKKSGNEAETSVAVSHTNPLQLAAVSNLGSGGGLFHGWSTDGGLTWQRDTIADGDALGFACCDAQLAS